MNTDSPPSPHIVHATPEVIAAAKAARFARTMDLVCRHHPAYRRKIAGLGLSRASFAAPGDLAALPVTAKADYMADPLAYRLDLADGEPEETALWDVMHTTGTTTGRPTPFHSTTYDFFRILAVQEGMMRLRGVGPDDVIANLFPLTVWPHGAYARVPHAAAAMKIPVVSALPGNPSSHFAHGSGLDEVVAIVARIRATILWGVPSYVRRVLIRAQEIGADFAAVRFVFVTGEATPEAMRTDFETRLGTLGARDVFVSISYGATEMQGGMVECAPGSGFHSPAPDQYHIEIVDPETHEPLPRGAPGLVLLSHIDRRGTVLLRYALGDVSVLADGPCPRCGSHTERLVATPSRIDALLKIKGTLVNPALIEDVLLTTPGVREYQIVVDRQTPADPLSPDVLRLRLDCGEAAAASVPGAVRAAVGVTPEIEIVPAAEIHAPGDTLKSRRVDDRRGRQT